MGAAGLLRPHWADDLTCLQDVRNWVLSWGRHAVVLEPEELREEISEEAAAMLGMYGEERASRSV